MAQSKFLTYEGLEHLVSKVATTINGEASTESIKLTLHGKTKDSNGNVISTGEISNVILPLAGALGNSNAGLITAAERTKLTKIVNTDGEANQNAFSFVKVAKNGEMTADATVEADSKTDTLTVKAGTNISISADITNDAITINNTYKHPDYAVIDKGPNTNQTPGFGSTFNIISKIASNSTGHLSTVNINTVTIPALPTPKYTLDDTITNAEGIYPVLASISGLKGGTEISSNYTLVNMPTKAYVDKAITDGITTSASMVLKGSFNTTSGEWYTTTTFSQGDTYVSTQTINHSVFGAIEPGDLIIANKNGASKTVKDDWIIVQKNVDLVGAKDTIGLIKNGSPVTDASGYTASPIIGGIPYYKYTDDTKVTAVGNHYAPAADDNSQLTSTNTNSGTASWNSTELITGIKVQRDAKGHVTGITTTSHKMPTNPDTIRDIQVNGASIGSTVPLNLINGNNVTITKDTSGNVTIASAYTDTKNTAGSTDTSSKIFLIGAISQEANPQTYSHNTAYVGTDGCLYSDSKKVLNGAATTSVLGGIKLYSEASTSAITIDGNKFALKLDSNSKAYVEIAAITDSEINALFA